MVDVSSAAEVLTQVVSPTLLTDQPLNALRLTLHPQRMAPHIGNLSQWRAFVLGGLRRSAQARTDTEMLALHDELAAYPHDEPDCAAMRTDPDAVYVPLLL